ncbi:hypothetical protein [Mammaliicoccus phage vB_MscM-PMS3]|nr:hypothetical protein [Mammaliicoccus phage vB_MscM-PMS3]
MLENEFKQLLDKRKEQLESKKTFDSPDWFQWHTYTVKIPGRYTNYSNDWEISMEQRGKLYEKREGLLTIPWLLTSIVVWLLIANIILCAVLLFSGISATIPIVMFFVLLLVAVFPKTKLLTNIVDKVLGYNDNHNYKFYDCKSKVAKRYSNLHKLYYVNGEYYRKWYIEYVLGLDASEFVREDDFSSLIMDTVKGNYVDGKHLYDNKYHSIVEIIESGMSQREHWVNSLPTTRFLTYKEFMTIEETSNLVKSVKEKDKYITQFEDYMKNKDKLNKERYNEQ